MRDPFADDFPEELPAGRLERALALRNLLISRAENELADSDKYALLRREFMDDSITRGLLPKYVLTCRDLGSFWPIARSMSPGWEGRRAQIREDFEPLLDHLESGPGSPLDDVTSTTLASFSAESVAADWQKALERRERDAEGAITMARTLLESVCKHILDAAKETYDEGADLPRLYTQVAKLLNLAPSAHTEEVFKQILGGCNSVVVGLGAVRNKISDAHGRGATRYRPSARHAALAVNLSGAMASFLVETWRERSEEA